MCSKSFQVTKYEESKYYKTVRNKVVHMPKDCKKFYENKVESCKHDQSMCENAVSW